MRVTLESTSKIVDLITPQGTVPARLWEGFTDHGVACHAYITRIAVDRAEDASEFERDLQAHRAPSPVLDAVIPLRMVL